MPLEAATYISGLNPANPVGVTDPKSQGDDHLRLIKATLLNTFPNIAGAMNATHAELNALVGITGRTGVGPLVLGTTPALLNPTITDGVFVNGSISGNLFGAPNWLSPQIFPSPLTAGNGAGIGALVTNSGATSNSFWDIKQAGVTKWAIGAGVLAANSNFSLFNAAVGIVFEVPFGGVAVNFGAVPTVSGQPLVFAPGNNVFTGSNRFGDNRTYFGSANDVYAVMVAYNNARASIAQGCYMGASDSVTPDLIFSNASGAGLVRMNNDGSVVIPGYISTGNVFVNGGPVLSHSNVGFPGGKVTFSTAGPSGGADGDIWFQYV